jgi:hypothetical protein
LVYIGEFDCGFRTADFDECTAHEASCANRPEQQAERAAVERAAVERAEEERGEEGGGGEAAEAAKEKRSVEKENADVEERAKREGERAKEEAVRKLSGLKPFAGLETVAESVKPRGVKVRTVKPAGPFASAGITTQESIVAVQGVYIESSSRFVEQIKRYTPGDSIEVELHNDLDGLYKVTVEIGAAELAMEAVRDLRRKAGVPDSEKILGRFMGDLAMSDLTEGLPQVTRVEGGDKLLCPYRHVLRCETTGKTHKPQCTICNVKIPAKSPYYDCVCTTACESCANHNLGQRLGVVAT